MSTDPEVDQDDDRDEASGYDPNVIPAATARGVLEHVVRAIVDDPDSVDVEVGEGRRAVALNVRVGPGDMGRVIGKRGRTAGAIRTVVRAAASRDEVDVEVEFLD